MKSSSIPDGRANQFRRQQQHPNDEDRIPEFMVRGAAATHISTSVYEEVRRLGSRTSGSGQFQHHRGPFNRGFTSQDGDEETTTDASVLSSTDDSDTSPTKILKLPSAYYNGTSEVLTPPRGSNSGGPLGGGSFSCSSSHHWRLQQNPPSANTAPSCRESEEEGVYPNAYKGQIQEILMKQRQQEMAVRAAAVKNSHRIRRQQQLWEVENQQPGQQLPGKMPGGLRVAFQSDFSDDDEEPQGRSAYPQGLHLGKRYKQDGSFGDPTDVSPHRNVLRRQSLSEDRTDDENDAAVWRSGGQGSTSVAFYGQDVLPSPPYKQRLGIGQGIYPIDHEQPRPKNNTRNSTGSGIYGHAVAFVGKILPVKSPSPVMPQSAASIASDFDGRSITTAMDNKSHASRLSVPSCSSEKTWKINNLSPQNPPRSNNVEGREGSFFVRCRKPTHKEVVVLMLILIFTLAVIIAFATALGGKNKDSSDSSLLPGLRPQPTISYSVAPSITLSPMMSPTQEIPSMPPVQEAEGSTGLTDSSTALPSSRMTASPASFESGRFFTPSPTSEAEVATEIATPTHLPTSRRPTPPTLVPTYLTTTPIPSTTAPSWLPS